MNVHAHRSIATRRLLAIAIVLCTGGIGHAAKIELPSWSEEVPENPVLGGDLFPMGLAPTFQSTEGEVPTEVSDETELAEKAAGTELEGEAASEEGAVARPAGEVADEVAQPKPPELRLPVPMPLRFPENQPEIEIDLPPVEGALRDEYFSYRPVEHLIDPQSLLTEQKKNDLARFMEYHAEEARYDIYLMVFGETQQIPADIDLDALHREWFQGEDVVLAVYHLGRPEETTLNFGKEVTNLLPQEIFDRVQEYCIAEAQIATDLADQTERYMIELSTRLWWVAKLIERQVLKGTALTAAEAVVEMNNPNTELSAAETASSGAGLLTADSPAAAVPQTIPVPLAEVAKPSIVGEVSLFTWVLASAIFLVLLIGAGIGFWIWRRDALTAPPVLFPDRELPNRLGGEFSGGGFVGMSFALDGKRD